MRKIRQAIVAWYSLQETNPSDGSDKEVQALLEGAINTGQKSLADLRASYATVKSAVDGGRVNKLFDSAVYKEICTAIEAYFYGVELSLAKMGNLDHFGKEPSEFIAPIATLISYLKVISQLYDREQPLRQSTFDLQLRCSK